MSPHFTIWDMTDTHVEIVKRRMRRSGPALTDARLHQGEVEREAQPEGNEPRVPIEMIQQAGIRDVAAGRRCRVQEPGHHWKHRDHERDHSRRIPTAALSGLAILT